MSFMSYANNKGTDQPAHPHSLISAFVVHCFDSMISLDSITQISRLASLCTWAGWFVYGLVGNSRRHVLSCRGSFKLSLLKDQSIQIFLQAQYSTVINQSIKNNDTIASPLFIVNDLSLRKTRNILIPFIVIINNRSMFSLKCYNTVKFSQMTDHFFIFTNSSIIQSKIYSMCPSLQKITWVTRSQELYFDCFIKLS